MLDALTLGQIRTFVAIAEAGGFRAGAARLLRAQSAVSHAVAALEAQLGLVLFDRSGRRPVLTPVGQALLEDARAVILKVDLLRARARGLTQGLEIDLPLVVDTLFPLPLVAAALRDLSLALPSVRVHLSAAPLGAPMAALRDGGCSVAITVGEDFRDPRIELEALLPLQIVAVVAADHPLARHAKRRRTVGPAELAEHLQIVLQDPTPLSAGRDFGVLSPRTWRVGEQDTKRALVLAGVGWARLPSWSVRDDLEQGRLVRVSAGALGPRGATQALAYLANRTDRPPGPAARTLRESLVRHAAGYRQD